MLLKANWICDSWRMWLSLLKALVLQNHSVEFSKFAGHLFPTDCHDKPLPTILLKCIFLTWLDLMNLICSHSWPAVGGFHSCCFSCSSLRHRHPQGWPCDLCQPLSAEGTAWGGCGVTAHLWSLCVPRSWLNRRQLDGSLNRTPAGFYDRVWQILERTPNGLIVAGRFLPQVINPQRLRDCSSTWLVRPYH